MFFLFLDRVNISLAAPYLMDGLKLNGVEMGIVLSMYYWGYMAGQLGGGFAADHWTIRIWASVMFLAWCVLTVLTGVCNSLWQLALVRGLFGACEGAVANPTHKLENHWGVANLKVSCRHPCDRRDIVKKGDQSDAHRYFSSICLLCLLRKLSSSRAANTS